MTGAPAELTAAPQSLPIAGGAFVAVVGPSGAGKDSVIQFAQAALAADRSVFFARRVITRPSDPSAEAHDTLDEAAFAKAEQDGAFAVAWHAHGLRYGLPAEIDAKVAHGAVVVANVSRAVLPAIKARYARTIVAEITARPDILAKRLAARGRETPADVLARLARPAPATTGVADVVGIDNSGPLAVAGGQFLALLRDAAVPSRIN
ncbi:MAG: phosphonate metabolism protein/1,5-bisphosphokinase (PRPP-forming) PhnN [Rhizobiaceae bacterium]|nr:phosphonate metabolism protein/1,5-bisphosphokinase (PRPP-forming) PhnN [Rhizobiaceae bacterium]